MWKAIVAGTAALAIAGTSLAVAQQRGREGGERWRPSTEDLRAFGEARLAARNAAPSEDPVERLRQRATSLSETGAALKKLAEATDPLYKSLDESQKRRFVVLSRLARSDRGFAGRGEREFRGRDGGMRDWGSERGGMREWGPRRMNGPTDLEHSGEQRL